MLVAGTQDGRYTLCFESGRLVLVVDHQETLDTVAADFMYQVALSKQKPALNYKDMGTVRQIIEGRLSALGYSNELISNLGKPMFENQGMSSQAAVPYAVVVYWVDTRKDLWSVRAEVNGINGRVARPELAPCRG